MRPPLALSFISGQNTYVQNNTLKYQLRCLPLLTPFPLSLFYSDSWARTQRHIGAILGIRFSKVQPLGWKGHHPGITDLRRGGGRGTEESNQVLQPETRLSFPRSEGKDRTHRDLWEKPEEGKCCGIWGQCLVTPPGGEVRLVERLIPFLGRTPASHKTLGGMEYLGRWT